MKKNQKFTHLLFVALFCVTIGIGSLFPVFATRQDDAKSQAQRLEALRKKIEEAKKKAAAGTQQPATKTSPAKTKPTTPSPAPKPTPPAVTPKETPPASKPEPVQPATPANKNGSSSTTPEVSSGGNASSSAPTAEPAVDQSAEGENASEESEENGSDVDISATPPSSVGDSKLRAAYGVIAWTAVILLVLAGLSVLGLMLYRNQDMRKRLVGRLKKRVIGPVFHFFAGIPSWSKRMKIAGAVALFSVTALGTLILFVLFWPSKPPVVVPNSDKIPNITGLYPLEIDRPDMTPQQLEVVYELRNEYLEHMILSKLGAREGYQRYELYRETIAKAAEKHKVDAKRLAAKYLLESQLDKDKESPNGAAGIAQIMWVIAREVSKLSEYELLVPKPGREKAQRYESDNPDDYIDHRKEAELSIYAGAWMVADAYRYWKNWDLANQEHHSGQPLLKAWVRAYLDDVHAGWEKKYDSLPAAFNGLGCTLKDMDMRSAPPKNPNAYKAKKAMADDSASYYARIDASERLLDQMLAEPKAFEKRADLTVWLYRTYHLDSKNDPARWWWWYGKTRTKIWEEGYQNCEALQKAADKGDIVSIPLNAVRNGFYVDINIGQQYDVNHPEDDYIDKQNQAIKEENKAIAKENEVLEKAKKPLKPYKPLLKKPHDHAHVDLYKMNSRESWGMILYVAYELRRRMRALGLEYKPLKVSAVVRSKWYQKKVGKTGFPLHITADAVDVGASTSSISEVEEEQLKAVLNNLGGLGEMSYSDEAKDRNDPKGKRKKASGAHYHLVLPPDANMRAFYRSVYFKFFAEK